MSTAGVFIVTAEQSAETAKEVSADMTSSGYTPLPTDPPPAYAPGAVNSGFAGDHGKDVPQAAVPPAMSPYPGIYVHCT